MSVNTTSHLMQDIETLRDHLRIDRWLVFGLSWGSTLALAYAEQSPERVSELVLSGVTMTRRSEIDWLYRGLAPLFPEQWSRFREGVPEEKRDGDLVEAYHSLLNHPDPLVRFKAAREWHAWEAASVSVSGSENISGNDASRRFELARARIITHYFRNAAWLEDGALLREAIKLANIRGVMVQGRLDLEAPLVTAWELSRAWKDGTLVIVPDAGHSVLHASMSKAIVQATDRFGSVKWEAGEEKSEPAPGRGPARWT